MLLKVYALRDEIAGASEVLFTAPNDGILKRQIKAFLGAKESNIVKENYEDKRLYYVGTFDTASGLFTDVARATDFVLSVSECFSELVADIKRHQALLAQKEAEGVPSDE